MNISNVNFQFNSKVAPNKSASNSVLFSGNNDDLFVKTQILKEEKVSSSKYETALSCQELEKIYATTFENSIKMNYFSNPVLRYVNYKKPDIKIRTSEQIGQRAAAMYNFPENTISILEKFVNEDIYFCYSLDGSSENINNLFTCTSSELDDVINSQGNSFEVIKLNKKEKEIYLSNILSHELRHSFQNHLLASISNYSANFIDKNIAFTKFINKMMGIQKEAIAEAQKNGVDIPQELINQIYYVDTSYAEKYSPIKDISSSVDYKLSFLSNDNRSMKLVDLYKAWEKNTGKKMLDLIACDIDSDEGVNEFVQNFSSGDYYSESSYFSDLTELDAFNNQLEYFYLYNENSSQGARKIVIELMHKEMVEYVLKAFYYAEQEKTLPTTLV